MPANSLIRNSILGIDIGSVSLNMVQMDKKARILNRFCQVHKGNISDTIRKAADIFDLSRVGAVACTSSSIFLNRKLVHSYNAQVAVMEASRHFFPDVLSVLHIGAEKFMLIRFDPGGNYRSAKINTSCAAGTGSFLDQQAVRLNLSGIEELCEKALNNKDQIPEIASRCAVFSRTDIIHAQQRGYSVSSICQSLCRGLAENIVNTVFTREEPVTPILMTGGVSRNSVVRH
jgi:activator of 2-hydroxyglutaryl-CoA dehydratase